VVSNLSTSTFTYGGLMFVVSFRLMRIGVWLFGISCVLLAGLYIENVPTVPYIHSALSYAAAGGFGLILAGVIGWVFLERDWTLDLCGRFLVRWAGAVFVCSFFLVLSNVIVLLCRGVLWFPREAFTWTIGFLVVSSALVMMGILFVLIPKIRTLN